MSRRFEWPVRVYYEDTDAGGVVFYANYLKYLERARTEWLRACGYDQTELVARHGILFAVARLEVRYRQPARLDDRLVVSAEIAQLRGSSITFQQSIVRESDDELLCLATVKAACVGADSFRPQRLPEDIVAELTR